MSDRQLPSMFQQVPGDAPPGARRVWMAVVLLVLTLLLVCAALALLAFKNG